MEKKYADVIVGISHEKIDRAFQYIVPQHLQTELEIGMCVHIPFGRGNHIQEGNVIGFSEQAEGDQTDCSGLCESNRAQYSVSCLDQKLLWMHDDRCIENGTSRQAGEESSGIP